MLHVLPVIQQNLTMTQRQFWAAIGHPLRAHPYAAILVAIATNETLGDDAYTFADACCIVSADDGHGVLQLTSSWPINWTDPRASAEYAIEHFIEPAGDYWEPLAADTSSLVRLIAATYNEGLGAAIRWHDRGNVDGGTTNDYAARALTVYERITT